MNSIQVRQSSATIIARLDEARHALASAQNNFERVRVRDHAKALQSAAEILNRLDIQVQASLLVQDAERAIAQANPPRQGKRTDLVTPGNEVEPKLPISQENLRRIRQAHDNLSDKNYEELKANAVENEEPLSRKGLLEVSKQKKQAENRQKRDEQLAAQATQLPTGEQKYTVLYADPPWKYDFSETTTREIENHYPTMELVDIKALKVAEICHEDAVLYLWTTAPKLPEAVEVMTTWGFTYKSNAVWVKDKIGHGVLVAKPT